MILFFYLNIVFSIIIGIDPGSNQFRAAIPNSSKSIFFLDSKESFRLFPTTFCIKSENEINKTYLTPENIPSYQYEWISLNSTINFPNSTIIHPNVFLSKVPTSSFVKHIKNRKYFNEYDVFGEEMMTTSGILPQVIVFLTLRRIQQKIFEGGAEIVQSVIAVPKFWLQSQRESFYYPAKLLKMNPILIDSSTALASFIFSKHKKYIGSNPHCFLILEMGSTSIQAIVYEFGKKEKLIAQELYYSWSDRIGGRDFDSIISSLIKKQTKGQSDPYSEANRMIEAEKVKILLNEKEEISNDYEGGFYKINRKSVESAINNLIFIINDLINNIFKVIPIIEIDKVELTGGSIKFYPIINLIKKIFGLNRISIDERSEEAIVIGTSWLAAQKIQVNALPIYSLIISQNNQKHIYNGKIPFKNGIVNLLVENEKLPIGTTNLISYANITKNSIISENPSHILKFKNVYSKMPNKWLNESFKIFQLINQQMIFQEKIQLAKQIITYELGNYTEEIEDSELLDEVMSLEERYYVEKELNQIKNLFQNIYINCTLDQLLKIQDMTRSIMILPLMKKENKLFFLSSCEKMFRTLSKIENEIKSLILIYKNFPLNDFRQLIRPIIEYRIWLGTKISRQSLKNETQPPIIWWFEIERKSNSIETMYKTLLNKYNHFYFIFIYSICNEKFLYTVFFYSQIKRYSN